MTPLERATSAVMRAMADGPGTRDHLRCQAIARAVLQAIREPSDGQIAAARESLGEGIAVEDLDDNALVETARAMIDAALEEGTTK